MALHLMIHGKTSRVLREKRAEGSILVSDLIGICCVSQQDVLQVVVEPSLCSSESPDAPAAAEGQSPAGPSSARSTNGSEISSGSVEKDDEPEPGMTGNILEMISKSLLGNAFKVIHPQRTALTTHRVLFIQRNGHPYTRCVLCVALGNRWDGVKEIKLTTVIVKLIAFLIENLGGR
ncbi:unnamed protein product [Strongylus vulgaris]|uniref:Uncharacterized protein n=1 Tax=Strongylus vulgaris TaxID=40348 RepID=A0A3P7KLS0_STRVU|nr:unnamed protein product [Strongylus vulgaris]